MIYGLLGALMIVGGVAAWIVASHHHPGTPTLLYCIEPCAVFHTGWTQTVYDLVIIGGWMLLGVRRGRRPVRAGARAEASRALDLPGFGGESLVVE